MKNTFGNQLTVTLFGESHGPMIGAVLDGLPAGIPVDEARISAALSERRPVRGLDTARIEQDAFQLASGVFNGKTCGTPLCILIPNENVKSGDYSYGVARPSHADYAAFCKYRGNEDYRGGGHFSGRVTAALTAAGAIVLPALEHKNIRIETTLEAVGGTEGEEEMTKAVLSAREAGDSLGGILKTVISGVPAGVGEPWFDSVESLLSHAVFSIGGVKGIEFGLGFGFSDKKGSETNDALTVSDGRVLTKTNHDGGINGGITNGMDIVFRTAVKPTPSIAKTQETVNFLTNENTEISVSGRHDPAFVRRLPPVLSAVSALVISDLLLAHFGAGWLTED